MSKQAKRLTGLSLFAAGMLLAGGTFAQTAPVVDPHAVWERSCYSCHTEHAADFARLRLTTKAGKLIIASTGKELAPLLKNHRGVKLKTEEIAAISQLFRNGLAWGGVYQHRCASCHDKAVTLARTTLKLDGEKLIGQKDGRDIATFLATHGEATATEIATLVEMLKYQLATAAKP